MRRSIAGWSRTPPVRLRPDDPEPVNIPQEFLDLEYALLTAKPRSRLRPSFGEGTEAVYHGTIDPLELLHNERTSGLEPPT